MFNTLFNFLTDFISLNMNFFNFHHHNPQISYGIYNSTPEEKIPEHYFSVGIHPQNIHEQWENDLENLKIISQNPMAKHFAAVGLCASRSHSRKFLCTHSGFAAVYLCLPVVGTTYIYRYAKPNCSHVGIGFGSANAHHTDVWNDLSH